MYQELPKTIELLDEAPPLEVEQSPVPWDAFAVLLILLVAFAMIGIFGVKAWQLRRMIKYRKGSRHNTQRKFWMRIYLFLMISVVITSEILIYSIALR